MQFRLMLGKKCRPMPDTHDTRFRQAGFEQDIHLLLARLIESRRGLIEEDPIRTNEQDARKGQPLLLSEGQDPAPVIHHIQPFDEFLQADLPQDVFELFLCTLILQRMSTLLLPHRPITPRTASV